MTAWRLTLGLLPYAAMVFLAYAAVGLPLSALPLAVHEGLGFGTVSVGVVMGLAPIATLLTRQLGGRVADRRGPRFGVVCGLVVVSASGAATLLSGSLPPAAALAALMAGRVLLGLGDSLATTAITAWMVTRFGPQNAGRCMAWVGIAMYGALAIGAPAGAFLADAGGLRAVAVAIAVLPLLGIPIALALASLAPRPVQPVPVWAVARRIWSPGAAMTLASAGFGTIAAFLALRFAALGWAGAGPALAGFGGAYILSRLFLAGLPDRLGGRRVAIVSLLVEATGLGLIAAAPSPGWAAAGTALTGLGYSLVFPSLGVEVIRRVSPETRGVALGLFLACFDAGVGLAGPMAGLVAGRLGLPAAFLAATLCALAGLALVAATLRR